ncbi:cyclic AMP receptor-like protein [bacterium BMS3Abin07]|nr:cyclic AMP receptor-like protein [bacterium BMS3Abin07]GBE31900.1 cyclic AMP receptor-like protein [bacterium BMS3Bbin05]HDO21795.1 Crp/Fnr family transcriptional regulator [Nitrospirota bacterium]
MQQDKIDHLSHIEFFLSLTKEELKEVAEKIHLKTYGRNQIILFEEDTSAYMYIIIYGKVKVFQTSEDGKESIIAFHGTGDFFGEMALIDKATVPANVMAKEKSLIAIISKDDFYDLLYSQRKILDNLLQILCGRLRRSWQKIHILNLKTSYERIKMLFHMLSEDHGTKNAKGTILNIKLTHQDIADMTGLTRETVTRVIDRWKGEKAMSVLKNKYIHLSPNFFRKHYDNVI